MRMEHAPNAEYVHSMRDDVAHLAMNVAQRYATSSIMEHSACNLSRTLVQLIGGDRVAMN